jgi:preflagellin peptidase FlaK
MYFLTCEYVVDLEKKKVNYLWLLLIVIGIIIIVYQIYVFRENIWFNFFYLQLFSIILLIFIFYIFYLTNLLHGGADTKAMMAIAILVAFYPSFAGFPLLKTTFDLPSSIALQLVFPYALIILFNAVILSIFIPIGFAVYNTTKGHFKFPHMFLGYKMDVDINNAKKFVWLMERVDDGKLYSVLRPSKVDKLKLDEELKKLKEFGIKKVWVTPQIPFMITLTIGYVFAFLIGNIMFLIVNLFV